MIVDFRDKDLVRYLEYTTSANGQLEANPLGLLLSVDKKFLKLFRAKLKSWADSLLAEDGDWIDRAYEDALEEWRSIKDGS